MKSNAVVIRATVEYELYTVKLVLQFVHPVRLQTKLILKLSMSLGLAFGFQLKKHRPSTTHVTQVTNTVGAFQLMHSGSNHSDEII